MLPVIAPQDCYPVRVLVRKSAQQHRIDDAEDGSIRPDARSQGQYGSDCEARALPQVPAGVRQVLRQFVKHAQASGLSALFFRAFD